MLERYDVVIIGSGPAGLSCALALPLSARCLIIDQGKDMAHRQCVGLNACAECNNCSIATGFGGAGLLSDGKVLSTLRLAVGALSERDETPEYCTAPLVLSRLEMLKDHETKQDLEKTLELNGLFLAQGSFLQPRASAISVMAQRAKFHGIVLDLTSGYHFGTDGLVPVVKAISRRLACRRVGRRLTSTCDSVMATPDGWQVRINSSSRSYDVFTRALVIATGKSGAAWLERLCHILNIPTRSPFIDIGARVLLPTKLLQSFTGLGPDPRFRCITSLGWVRSHCYCYGGDIIPYRWDRFVVAGGHSRSAQDSLNSNFAILVRKACDGMSRMEAARRYLELWNSFSPNHLIFESLSDFLRHEGSGKTMSSSPFGVRGDLRSLFQPDICAAIEELIKKILDLAQIADSEMHEALLCGPAMEWPCAEIPVDGCGAVIGHHGIYVVGDAAGRNLGITSAIRAGTITGNAISEQLKSGFANK